MSRCTQFHKGDIRYAHKWLIEHCWCLWTVDAGAVRLHQLTLRRQELIERLHAVSNSPECAA